MDADQAARWLSEPRWSRFVTEAAGDTQLALELYAWHAELSRECFGFIHGFEVILRNAIDAALGAGQPQEPVSATWLLDPAILAPHSRKMVNDALTRLVPEKRTRGGVVATLMFGFWGHLFTRRYEELWRQDLRAAFPAYGSATRQDLSRRLEQIRLFRNRIAHHDALFDVDVEARLEDMRLIISWIDPEAADWLATSCAALPLLARRPH